MHIDFVERIIKPISLCDRNKTAEVHRRVIPQYCLIVMSGWLTRFTVPGASLFRRDQRSLEALVAQRHGRGPAAEDLPQPQERHPADVRHQHRIVTQQSTYY